MHQMFPADIISTNIQKHSSKDMIKKLLLCKHYVVDIVLREDDTRLYTCPAPLGRKRLKSER